MDDGEPREPVSEGSGGPAPWYLSGGQAPAPTTPAPLAPAPAAPTTSGSAWGPTTPAPAEAASQQAWRTAPGTWPSQPPAVGQPADRSRLVSGVIVAAVVALLAGGAFYLVGSPSDSDDGSSAESGSTVDSSQGRGSEPGPVVDSARVAPLKPVSTRATCQADPGVDSAGTTITYEPGLTLDAVLATAWRCPGSAVGHQLVYNFGRPVTLTSVGLVPGYAKVDPVDGSNRFAENRTVTAVTWRFDDGTSHRQTIGNPEPSMVSVELPRAVSTSGVVLEIAGTGNEGALRDFTPVSDVQFAGY